MLKLCMSKGHLDVYILQTPGNSRADKLLQKLSADHRVNLMIVNSVMVGTESDVHSNRIELETMHFKVLEGRNLSFGEIGCAYTHNLARQKISESNFGGVVLEDDARVEDVDEFIETAFSFLIEQESSKSILTLTSFWAESKYRKFTRSNNSSPWVKLIGHAPLAVGYVATPKAAADVLARNTPIKFVADWPLNSCVFYVLKCPTVQHGDDSTTSLIDDANSKFRQGVTFSTKLSLFSCYSYLTKGIENVKFRDYVDWVYLRRIEWLIDKVLAKLWL